MKVLLVDDEKELISTIAERLAFRKIETEWVTEGDTALKMVENKRYDIAVLDIKMPGISGIELGEKIKEISPETEILYCTGQGDTGSFNNIHEFVTKPIDINLLIEKMNQMVLKEGS